MSNNNRLRLILIITAILCLGSGSIYFGGFQLLEDFVMSLAVLVGVFAVLAIVGSYLPPHDDDDSEDEPF